MDTLLSIFVLIFAIITIYSKLRDNETLQFIVKPLTMIAIILIAFLNSSAPMNFYQKAILIGLILSTIGDIFLIKQDQFFVQGLISFLLGHICFIAAFWTAPNWLSVIPYLIYVVFFLAILWEHLGKLKIPVIFYAIALALMSWMALSCYFESQDIKTLSAFVGSVIFIVSDSLLAFNKFKSPIPYSPVWILGTYFLAQWFIALSV